MSAPKEYPVLCINPGCRPADRGGPRLTYNAWFCTPCTDHAAEDLNYIADAWDDLEQNLTSSEAPDSSDQGKTKNAGKGQTGVVINERAVEARRSATAHVWSFARIVFDWADSIDRSIAGPREHTTPDVARWLAKWHINVFAVHAGRSTALAFIEDTSAIKRAVKSAAYPTGAKKLETGLPCVEHTTGELGERIACTGTMHAWVGPDSPMLPDLVCSADKTHKIDPLTWQRSGWNRAWNVGLDAEGMRRLAVKLIG